MADPVHWRASNFTCASAVAHGLRVFVQHHAWREHARSGAWSAVVEWGDWQCSQWCVTEAEARTAAEQLARVITSAVYEPAGEAK